MTGGNGDGEDARAGDRGSASPGVPATQSRVRSAALWGLVGGFAFLVVAQGYQLVEGALPVGYGGLFALAGAIAVASGGITYATEHRLHAKRRT
jgi:hypothetical protein